MGGWIAQYPARPDWNERMAAFRRTFSVAGVPGLHTKLLVDRPDLKVLGWAWNPHEIPDLSVAQRGHAFLVLCGALTGLGRFGATNPSDPELAATILRLWHQHGQRLLPEINGSFSLLVGDLDRRELIAATDRFASRSVWIARDGSSWLVGNFPAAMVALQAESPKLNPAGLWSLFHTGSPLGQHGLYAGLRLMLAGQVAEFSPDGPFRAGHWHLRRYRPDKSASPRQWARRLATALQASAQRYAALSRRPHLFLSGGLDSRIVAACFPNSLKTLTLCTKPNLESRIAGRVARCLGLDNRTWVRSPYWYLDTLDASSLISGGTHLIHHCHFTVPVAETVAQMPDAEFLLGDVMENFNKHYFRPVNSRRFAFSAEDIPVFFATCVPSTQKDLTRWGCYFNESVRKRIRAAYLDVVQEVVNQLRHVSDDDADRFDTLLRWAAVSVTYTYNMFFNIRALGRERNICFDNELDDLSVQLPASVRGKHLLHRLILDNLRPRLALIPDANDLLPPVAPQALKALTKKLRPVLGRCRRGLLHRDRSRPVLATSGSWTLMHELYRKDPRYQARLDALFHDEDAFPGELFDRRQVLSAWDEYKSGNVSLHFDIECLLSFANLHRLIPTSGIAL